MVWYNCEMYPVGYTILDGNPSGRDHSGDLGADGRISLRWILMTCATVMWTGCPVAGTCEHGSGTSGPLAGWAVKRPLGFEYVVWRPHTPRGMKAQRTLWSRGICYKSLLPSTGLIIPRALGNDRIMWKHMDVYRETRSVTGLLEPCECSVISVYIQAKGRVT